MPEVIVPLPVRGPLDTANPISNRLPGTLRTAVGTHNRQWGPHRGPAVFTWPRTGMGTLPGPGWLGHVTEATKYLSGSMTCNEQRDIGCRWTANMVLTHWAKTVTSADATVGGVLRKTGTYMLRVQVQGTGSANPGALKITVITSDNDSGGATYTITCTTDLRAIDCPVLRIRMIRDGAAFYVYVNGVEHYANTAVMSRAVPHTGPSNSLTAKWFIGDDGGSNSLIFVMSAFWMTDSVDTDDLYSLTPPSLLAPTLRFFVSSYYRNGVSASVFDWSRFRAHGSWSSTPSTTVDDRSFVVPCPILGMATFTDYMNRIWNVVCAGGTFYYQAGPATFDFERATAVNTDGSNTPISDPFSRMTMQPAGRMLLVLNGREPNLRCANPEDSVVQPLQIKPPRDEIMPLVGDLGTGKVFGDNYKWRYRYKNSKTGERSGMSPIPYEGLNLGMPIKTGSVDYLGVSCFFEIPGCSYTGIDSSRPGADRIELLRNTSGQENVYLVVGEQPNPGAGSVAYFEDDKDDIELSENAALYTNPDWSEGVMPPVQNAHAHPTGRTWYYGFERQPPYRLGTVAVSLAANLVTGTSSNWTKDKEGLGFRLLNTSDTTLYRIIEVPSATTMYVSPAIKTNTSMTGDALSGASYEIIDDRDLRTVWQSEPNKPTQMSFARRFFLGFHADDPLHGIFTFSRTTFALTKRRFYVVSGDMLADPAVDPSLSLQFSVIAEEGCSGPRAWCNTPFGIVYHSLEHGVRLFDGGSDPRPLGQQSALEEFLAKTQARNIHPDYIAHVTMHYDDDQHMVYMGYCPPGHPTPTEVMAFDPLAGTWRGPWQVCQYVQGQLADSSGVNRCVYGDDRSNLYRMEQQAANLISPATWTLTGDVTAVQSAHHPTIGLTHDRQMNGIPIVFLKAGTGNPFVDATIFNARVIGAGDSNGDVVLDRTIAGLTTDFDFWLGGIYWDLTTAYVDAQEPVQTKKANTLRMRFDKGASGQTFYVGCAKDGATTYPAEGDTVWTVNPTDIVYNEARIYRGDARAFQYRFHGVTTTGGPVVSAVDALIHVGLGQ